MIYCNVEAEGKCKGCPYMELEVDVSKYWAGGKPLIAGVSAKCINEELCYSLENYLRDHIKENESK